MIKRLVSATLNSLRGLRLAYFEDTSFRWEVWLLIILVPLSFYVEVGHYERLAMIVSLLMVVIVELINTALEAVVDLVMPNHHAKAAKAKDTASAAVFISVIVAVVVWFVILFG